MHNFEVMLLHRKERAPLFFLFRSCCLQVNRWQGPKPRLGPKDGSCGQRMAGPQGRRSLGLQPHGHTTLALGCLGADFHRKGKHAFILFMLVLY